VNPGEIALNGSMLIAVPVALLAGIVTFISPCVLPLVPGYLGYVSGSANTKTRVMTGAILFVLGFSAVFVSLGVLAGTAGLLVLVRNPLDTGGFGLDGRRFWLCHDRSAWILAAKL